MNKADMLARLREETLACHKCRLSSTRTKVVFGEGDPESPLVIVGEGPGATEDETGIPFVGKAGRLLTECLMECGIERKRVFICNVVKCRACIVGEKTIKNRPPEPDEIDSCKDWLLGQLAILQPMVILALGAPATRFLLGRQNVAMTKERGVFYESAFGIPVIPSLHPSYILRNQYKDGDGGKSLLVADIEAARKKVIELKRAKKRSEETGDKAPKVPAERPAEQDAAPESAEPFDKYSFREKELGI
ncbi:MAG: uracil-DNA glycosylase [Abditibacteriota bacterium]|nr:uracil-DNA glycosylase [Abditibacteriota bacterium]